ncbi:Ribonuclease HII [Chitinispirillum alkaliphilum]|nr:Ribonuclease HII [Chitinispirillum alkaliphilum]
MREEGLREMSEKGIHDTGKLYSFDQEFLSQKGILSLAGVDEAGRGPLAGPVVAAAVILDQKNFIPGLNDSKQLKEKTREQLYALITEQALFWSTGLSSAQEVDRLNVLRATFLAMQRALEKIGDTCPLYLIDGNQSIPEIPRDKQQTVVKGDSLSASVAAASIVAKVTRDRMMRSFHEQYGNYDFDKNKGYGTAEHIKSIKKFGLSPVHRRSFCEHFLVQIQLEFD